jgi:hypothetical protein
MSSSFEEGLAMGTPRASLARRRRRQAAGVVLLGLVLAGAVVVARASSPTPRRPVAPPTPTTQAPAFPGGMVPWIAAPPRPPTPAQPAAVPPATPACTANRLRARAGWEGATGSLAGWVRLTSRARARCRLRGYPTIQLLDQQGRALPTRTGRYGRSQATGVLLRPGTAATVTFVWRNWCGPNPGRLGLRVTLPGRGSLVPAVAAGTPRKLAARCDASGAPSTLSRGPFAPELPTPPPSLLEGLTATIALPPTAVAGRPLRYTVSSTSDPGNQRDRTGRLQRLDRRTGAVTATTPLPDLAASQAVGPVLGGGAVWLAGPYTRLLHGGGILLRVDPASGRATGWFRDPLWFLQDVLAAGPRGAWVGTAAPELLHVVPA